jgi:hypothetical protein
MSITELIRKNMENEADKEEQLRLLNTISSDTLHMPSPTNRQS